MALGRNLRTDSRSPLSYSYTVALVVFVAFCLVKLWMMTSPTIVPIDISSSETNFKMKEQASATDLPFEDNPGDVPEDAVRGDTNNKASTDTIESNKAENTYGVKTEKSADKTQGENSVQANQDLNDDANRKTEVGGTDSDSGEMNSSNQENGQDKIIENKSGETTANKHEKKPDKNSDEIENNEQTRNSELNSKETIGDEQQQLDREKETGKEEKSKGDTVQDESDHGQLEKVEKNQDKEAEPKSDENKTGNQVMDQILKEVFPDGAQSELLNETNTQNGAWPTQDAESKNEKEVQASSSSKGQIAEYSWKLCNVNAGADYIPCLDNEVAIKKLPSTKHYQHRERHCPEEAPTCLVRLPDKFKRPIEWPKSRDKVWYYNVPHTQLAVIKGHQNWVKVSGEYLTFPGGGTQFKHGALHYIDFIQEVLPAIAWGKQSRVILDVGCGVASFGGYLFDRDVLTMSFAPKDEHEAQVQFALERGIPAISAVMGTKRLPFPSRVFDVIHCARCRVPWHIEGGMLLLELNRLLRPGGYFVWSATPAYRKTQEDVGIWNAMSVLTKSMCWKLVTKKKDKLNEVGVAMYRKPSNNVCYERRKENSPPLCQESDDPDAAWNIPLQACMHRLPVDHSVRGSRWPEQWPLRLEKKPYWLNSSQVGVYGKAAPKDFQSDYEHWKHVVSKSYLNGIGIDWSTVRNVMDMRSVYGGFAAALRDLKVWVMNIVSIDSPDTLPIIYERGLFGMYHDWCESFSTYPRSYDLLHADHLFSKLKNRCKLLPVIAEVDRILRPEGKLIVRDDAQTISELESMARSLHWEIRLTYSKDNIGLLCIQKTIWRPQE